MTQRGTGAHRSSFQVLVWLAVVGFIFTFGLHTLVAAAKVAPTNDPFCIPLTGVYRQGPGTLRMVARLEGIKRIADPKGTLYLNREQLPALRAAQMATTNAQQLLALRAEYATQLGRAGLSAEAIQEFDALGKFVHEKQLRLDAHGAAFLQLERALAYLRLGEQENCLLNHSADSCLFPIQGAGVHQLQRGSRGAVDAFGAILQVNPGDLGARWLLNIAHMTLGEYPDKVPKELVIPSRVFASSYHMPRFPEAAAAAGVDVDDLAGGCIAEDFDGDGLLDIMASAWSLNGQLRFFHNNGNGTFTERTHEAGLLG